MPKASTPIEYIKVPKHWFTEPLNQAMKTAVRPPTARTRRKELVIEQRMPMAIFIELMKPMETGDINNLEWEDEEKTALKPTTNEKTFKTMDEYTYVISKPAMVDKFWRLQAAESKGRKGPFRRGLGSARLHLSKAAEQRGERTALLAQVTGNVTVSLKVPKKERAMPFFVLKYRVSTLNRHGHVEWATTFSDRTAAALRKQMLTHLQAMIDYPEYPTLPSMVGAMLQGGSESVRPESVRTEPPPPPQAE